MAADSEALHGVRVCVQLSKAAQASKHSRKLLEGELQDLGATCMQRLTKTCSYVIFQHKTDEPTAADRLADEQSVKDMAKKLAQVTPVQQPLQWCFRCKAGHFTHVPGVSTCFGVRAATGRTAVALPVMP